MRRCPRLRRWGARDPAAVHDHRRRAARRRRASRQRAGVAADRDPGRLFAPDADDQAQRGDPPAAGGSEQRADAAHGSGVRDRDLPLRSVRRFDQAHGPRQSGLYLGVVLYAQRGRLLRHQRPLRRPQGDRARSDDRGPARRIARRRRHHRGRPADHRFADRDRADRAEGAGARARPDAAGPGVAGGIELQGADRTAATAETGGADSAPPPARR